MGLFISCKNCGHVEEDHAMDAPEGQQECNAEGCTCSNFAPEDEDGEVEEHHQSAFGILKTKWKC